MFNLSKAISIIVAYFRSLKISIAILTFISLASALGAFIPQNKPIDFYIHIFGKSTTDLIQSFGLTEMFSSWWFLGLWVWLLLSLLTCSITRIRNLTKDRENHNSTLSPAAFSKKSFSAKTNWSITGAETFSNLSETINHALSKRRYKIRSLQTGKNFLLLQAEKGGWGRWGSTVIHVGVAIIILTTILTWKFGVTEMIELPVKSKAAISDTDYNLTIHTFTLEEDDKTRNKGNFSISVSLINKQGKTEKKNIKAGAPLRLQGFRIFPLNYRQSIESVSIEVREQATNALRGEFSLPLDKETYIPALKQKLRVVDFKRDFMLNADHIPVDRTQNLNNPALKIEYRKDGNWQRSHWLFLQEEGYHQHKDANVPYRFHLKKINSNYICRLRVVRNPFFFLIYTALMLMVFGSFLSCYVFHRQLWLSLSIVSEDKFELLLAGYTQKNSLDFINEFTTFSKDLSKNCRKESPALVETISITHKQEDL